MVLDQECSVEEPRSGWMLEYIFSEELNDFMVGLLVACDKTKTK